MRETATRDPAEEFRTIGEWDWWETPSGNVLHSADVVPDKEFAFVGGQGTTTCGRKTQLFIPGIFTRMGLRRCTRCCRALGYPEGIGSPKNDKRCRPLVKKRLASG